MSFITRRPTLPIGAAVQGFGEVRTVLNSDACCELYLLGSDEARSTVLALVPVEHESRLRVGDRLNLWWHRQGPERVSVDAVDDFDLAGGHLAAVLLVTGNWMGYRERQPPTESSLWQLLAGLLDLTVEGVKEGLRPNLNPSLLWMLQDVAETRLASVIASPPEEEGGERGTVRDIANAVYWFATGISPLVAGEPPSPLSRWCKTAGPALSGLIGKCLDPARSSDDIDSLTALRAEVQRLRSGGQVLDARHSHGPESVHASMGPQQSHAGGLAKVAGMHELKSLLEREVVKPLRDPEPFKRYGLTIPNGILLYGPPGCGKTYIARQLAEELGYYFAEIIPSEVASPYIHHTVLKIRDVFETARERAPSIVFIDEFEALVPARADLGGHQQFKSEEVNEFLAHLGACAEQGILVIGATNEPEKMDQAILRTGRLDKLVYVGPPDLEARAEMLRLHLSHRPVTDDLDAQAIARTLEGYSASDVKFLVDEAARQALERAVPISTEIILDARGRVPPSVSQDDVLRYQSFVSRGV